MSWTPKRGSVGWISRSLSIPKDEVEDKAGLDHAMYLEFLELSMRTVLSQPAVISWGMFEYRQWLCAQRWDKVARLIQLDNVGYLIFMYMYIQIYIYIYK